MTLKISDTLSLPLDAATRRLAILAMSGAGKSNVAVVMAEQMFDAGIPWVAIDPKGDWFGIRSSKSGKGAGLPIPILGGLHGDVPLEPTAGKVVAEMIVAERMTCVLDVSEFDTRQQLWGFLIDLGETLLKKNTQPLHLFLEEADEYLPQRTTEKGNLPRCLGVWQRVCKKGRTRGLGTTQITQRNASLNKDTLYQAECLIALRATGKADRDAVKGWVEYHNAAAEIVASLPTLADGEGWVSSPAWMRTTERVHFARRRTFDSGATPVMAQGTTPPATLATVDLDALSKRMAATIERAKADDPKELRRQIAELQKENQNISRGMTLLAIKLKEMKPETERVEVPVITDEARAEMKRLIDATLQHGSEWVAFSDMLSDAFKRLEGMLYREQRRPAVMPEIRKPEIRKFVNDTTTASRTNGGDHGLGGGEIRVLTAIAQHGSVTREQLTVLTGYKRSSRDTYIQRLRAAGMVEPNGDRIDVMADGVRAMGPDFEPLPTGAELRKYWLERLPEGEKKILAVLCDCYPDSCQRDYLSDVTDYKRSSRDTYLQRLKARELIEIVHGEPRASKELMES